MILNKVLLWVIVVVVSLTAVILVHKLLMKKTFFSSNTSSYIAFVLFLIFILLFFLNTKTVYLVKDKTNYASYYLIGSKNYKFKNGTSKTIDGNFNWCIINDYDKKLQLETVHYGSQWDFPDANHPESTIEPYSMVPILSGVVYFLDETPPKSNKPQTNYWLHE